MRKFKALCVLFAVLMVAAFVFVTRSDRPRSDRAHPTAIGEGAYLPQARATHAPFYGFIVGGIHNVDDFRKALSRDPALAAQFPGFDFEHARFELLKTAECDHVAYRHGGTFAWTKRCNLIPAGTLIMTDGVYRIRAACGNLLSAIPQAPIIPQDEEPSSLDMPDPLPTDPPSSPVTPMTPVPGTPTTPLGPPVEPLPPGWPILGCCGVPTPKPVAVPDHGEGCAALALTVIAIVVFWKRREGH
jgi:hypothetical protein